MSDPRPLLVLGGTGQVGRELRRTLLPLGPVVAPPRAEAELGDPDALRALVTRLRPAAVINAAAYTAVDRAEEDAAAAHVANAVAPGALAEAAAAVGAVMVHYSTDYVFDGTKDAPYVETDAPAPLNAYGATKLEGERRVAAAGAPWLVLRTSWVYAAHGHNFLRTMLRLAREREELRVVCDQVGAPTPARLVAEVTALVLHRHRAGDAFALPAERCGVYHLATRGRTSWHGFATAILAADPGRAEQRCTRVTPVTSAEFPTPARRPRWSVLDCTKLERTFGVRMPAWEEGLALVMEELAVGA